MKNTKKRKIRNNVKRVFWTLISSLRDPFRIPPALYILHNGQMFEYQCSIERTNLQLIHKEIVHKNITELNVLYSMSKLILI